MVLFVLELEWVLSTGQDKQFAWHCSESGQRLGCYRTSAVASGLQYPLLSKSLSLRCIEIWDMCIVFYFLFTVFPCVKKDAQRPS